MGAPLLHVIIPESVSIVIAFVATCMWSMIGVMFLLRFRVFSEICKHSLYHKTFFAWGVSGICFALHYRYSYSVFFVFFTCVFHSVFTCVVPYSYMPLFQSIIYY